MIEELKGSLSRSNITLENYLKSINKNEEQLKEELTPGASARAKGKIVLQEIAKKEEIKIEEADLDKEIGHLAEHAEKEFDDFKKNIRPEQIGYLQDYLYRKKALDLLVANADIKEENNV